MGESAAHSPVTYGLLGRTLKHSWSPQIHERLGTVPYELVELEPSELAAFVREGSWQGLNCTIPYKRDLLGLVDELRPNAKRIGAVNTLLHGPDGRVIGDNTDLFGFAWMLGRFSGLVTTPPPHDTTRLLPLATSASAAVSIFRKACSPAS